MASWQGHGTVPFRWTTWGDSLTSSGEILVAAEGRDPLGVLLEVAGNRLEAMVVMVEGWLKIRDLVVNYYSDSWVGWFTILIVEHSWVIYYSDLCLQKFALDFGWRTWFGQKGCNKMDSTLTWTAWTQSVTQTSNLIPAHAGTCCHISSHGQTRYGPSYRKGKGVYMFGWEPMGTLRWSEMSPRGKALLGEFTPWFSLKPCKTWFSPRFLFLKFETKINRTFPTFRSSPPKKDMFFSTRQSDSVAADHVVPGPDVTETFCRDNNLQCVIRSHEAGHGNRKPMESHWNVATSPVEF